VERVTIAISTGNAAFEGDYGYELARILRELADKFESGQEPLKIRDINGNTVGSVTYE
jgi:hypothetical protein